MNAIVGHEDEQKEEKDKIEMSESGDEEVVATIFKYILTQYDLKQRVNKFWKKAEDATEKELAQIHNMDALLLDANKLSEKEKKNAIASLIFLTEKRDGMIKARQCADGRKQQNVMVNEDSTSPTVTM